LNKWLLTAVAVESGCDRYFRKDYAKPGLGCDKFYENNLGTVLVCSSAAYGAFQIEETDESSSKKP